MKVIKVVAVHGFNVHDSGKRTTDTIAGFIEGAGWDIDVDEADYGFWSLWQILFWRGKARADVLYRIARAIEGAEIIYAHSNGVNFAYQALELLPAKFKGTKTVISISGAINASTPIPNAAKAHLTLYTPHDFWVKLSSYLPFNLWGRQGAIGHTGNSPQNVNLMDSSIKSHSGWWKEKNRRKTFEYIRNFWKENL